MINISSDNYVNVCKVIFESCWCMHGTFAAAFGCSDYHERLLPDHNASWYHRWRRALFGRIIFFNGDNSFQWLHWGFHVGGQASNFVQAQRLALLPLLGIYNAFMALECSNLTDRIWFLGSSNILCRWIWSKHYQVNLVLTFFCIISIDKWRLCINVWECRFLRQFLLYFFLHQMSISLFRLMGSLGRNMIVANTFGSFAMLIVMALGGYIISRGKISYGSFIG